MPHEERGCLGPLLCSFSVAFVFPSGPAGDEIAKHALVLCVHLIGARWWGVWKGWEIADSEIEGHFSRLTDHFLNQVPHSSKISTQDSKILHN